MLAQPRAETGRSRATPRAFGPRTYLARFGAKPPRPRSSVIARTRRAIETRLDAAASKSDARASCAV
jgi:hypothetical protein